MQAIVLENGAYYLRERERPAPPEGSVLIKVAYAGVNRADLFQKQGKYPLPEQGIPGMEVSGEIAALGKGVKDFKKGDRVCALMSEGAYSEYAVVPTSLIFPVPKSMTLEQAAALPEACFTAWISLVWQGNLKANETVLIHGGASGIGIIALQIARALGARVFATAGSAEKCAACVKTGAEKAINYKEEDFVQAIKAHTHKGVDVIMDMVGGDYFERNLEALKHGGRMSIIAFLKGSKVAANISPLLLKHLTVMGSTLRSRPLHEKEQVARELRERIWPKIEKSEIVPVIDNIFPLREAEKALARMQEGLNIGKIVLGCSPNA
jgi:putative PIG3 family NAD(P)H quinone oxidoreductase